MSSRLFQNVREKEGLCYYIGGSHYSDPQSGTFVFRAGMDKDRFPFAIEKMQEEFAKIASGDITDEEFTDAIGYRIGQLQMGIESSDEMADFLGTQYLLHGEIITLDDMITIYQNMKKEEVVALTKMMDKENVYVYHIE